MSISKSANGCFLPVVQPVQGSAGILLQGCFTGLYNHQNVYKLNTIKNKFPYRFNLLKSG
jgi:hypothetical protein